MTGSSSHAVILYASDMIFRSRIGAEARAAGASLTYAASLDRLREKAVAAENIHLVLVDMDMPDGADAIRLAAETLPDAQIVAYFAHVQEDLKAAATDAGAGTVLPRSQFVTRLPGLLSGAR